VQQKESLNTGFELCEAVDAGRMAVNVAPKPWLGGVVRTLSQRFLAWHAVNVCTLMPMRASCQAHLPAGHEATATTNAPSSRWYLI